MTTCKACGAAISFAYLEKHFCPNPNPAYEIERDKYRKAEVERRSRNERLGIAESPDPPAWVLLEVALKTGRILKFVTLKANFQFLGHRLTIDSATPGGWSERILTRSMETYRFREFPNEAEARAALDEV